jgi:hypothetical protein
LVDSQQATKAHAQVLGLEQGAAHDPCSIDTTTACLCRSRPAGESAREAMPVVWHESPAGWLLKGRRRAAIII